ncbi:MAG TPA: acyl-CoA thioesterase [Aeromonadales bacterium]|nr:acyl-CoA thioesterase [Aeromonadales bacterium]
MKTEDKIKPTGELLTRTVPMPADTNANGDIFGGWIMSQMDIASGIMAKSVAKSRVATVAVNGMAFHHPVQVGDTVACFGELKKIGTTSMNIQIEVWSQRSIQDVYFCVTEALFTYVAIDDDGKPIPVKR